MPTMSDPSKISIRSEGAPELKDEIEVTPVELLASGSHDDNFLANPAGLMTEPDPILGSFVTPASSELPKIVISNSRPSATFAALNLGELVQTSPVSSLGEEPEEDHTERRPSWRWVLLSSYASAITLALIWMIWGHSGNRDDTGRVAESGGVTRGRQVDLSRKIDPVEPIIAEHEIDLNQSLVVGSLEVTPLEVRREGVWLQKTSPGSEGEVREGGDNAWVLRLRLRNLTENEEFAPLDQAFLREQEKTQVDSYLQAGNGQRIYPYPLAIESEWSIFGQDFSALRPHESRVVSIVSAPDAPEGESGSFRWRVRLRTGINRTDVIAIRLTDSSSEGFQ
ncbi:hypothetical protein P12x_004157 [Tundrisphaera lichenicola]|uniref:hypothetical protein n=1 Tax=Tundrisphaera lichenicola TaxID=2029860 RepID=UPI003EC0F893